MTPPTPGPYELYSEGRTIVVGDVATHTDLAEFFYDGEHTVSTTRDEALANASRFMAAEDMLAALLWLKPYAELQVRKYPDGEEIGGWRMVLAAIERGTGGGG